MIEILLASSIYGFPTISRNWSNPVYITNQFALFLLLATIAFPLVAWPRRGELIERWKSATQASNLATSVLVNLGAFAFLLIARAMLSQFDLQEIEQSWLLGYCLLVLTTGATLALVAAPLRFWIDLAKRAPLEIALALGAASFALLASEVSQQSWKLLSTATLVVSRWLLSLYEQDVIVDMQTRTFGTEEFRVHIEPACSGYEGIALIIVFLAIYLWVFRHQLRFPNALCLVPIGIVAIWLLNSVRIALLVSIGAHLSPAVALNGFHSWFGWIAFLAATFGIIAGSQRSSFVWAGRPLPSPVACEPNQSHDRHVAAYLSPFVACLAASIVASAFAPHDQWLYVLRVVAVGGTLWYFRDCYARLLSGISAISVLAGLAVGVAWIVTDPLRGHETPLGEWIYQLPVSLAVLWITIRAFGSVALIPIVEELAFRGYLCRALMALRVSHISPGQLRWIALVVSSVAFGVLHDRWLAATLSGAVYAALMLRTKKVADPIAAHMASNGVIMFWSVAAQQWSLI